MMQDGLKLGIKTLNGKTDFVGAEENFQKISRIVESLHQTPSLFIVETSM